MFYRRNRQNMLPTPQRHRRKRFTNKSHVAASKAGAIDPMAFLTQDAAKVGKMESVSHPCPDLSTSYKRHNVRHQCSQIGCFFDPVLRKSHASNYVTVQTPS
jgi:hypothetical protein